MKSGGLILWNAIAICEMSKTSWKTGNHCMKVDLENHFKGQITPFGALVEYYPISARHQSRLRQFGKKVLPIIFLGYALIAEGTWKGDIMVANIEELENGRIGNLSSKNQCKKVLTPQKKEYLIFPVGRRYSKIVRKRPRIPRTHSKAGTTCWE